MIKLSNFVIVTFALFLWFGQCSASGHGNTPRDLAMHTLAKNMKAINQAMKGGINEDALNLGYEKSIEILKISERMEELFAINDSSRPKSRASSKIWTENERFKETLLLFNEAAFALVEAFKDENQKKVERAFQRTGAACGKCHKSYRLPKK